MRPGKRALRIAVVLFALALFGGCADDKAPCPMPLAPQGAREPVELPADAVPPDDAGAAVSPVTGAPDAGDPEAGEPGTPAEADDDELDDEAGVDSATLALLRVDLVYFHTANPCGCLAEVGDTIEATLKTHFSGEMEQRKVRFFSVVSDDPDNEHLVRMYGSQQFDLFLVTYGGGTARATQVPEIWSLLGDNEAISMAVQARVADGLARSG